MLKFLGFLCVFLENEFEIIFLELGDIFVWPGGFCAPSLRCTHSFYDVNCRLVDDITFSGRDELAGDDGFKGLQQG